MLSLIYSFKLYICQVLRIALAYTAQNTKKSALLACLAQRPSARLYCGGQLLQATLPGLCVHASSHTPGSWCPTLLWVSDGTGQRTLLRLASSLGPLTTRVWNGSSTY